MLLIEMNTISLQVLLALAMFVTTALAGLIPIKVLHVITKRQDGDDRQSRRAAWILTLLSCFAGGVFMGTCFLDIFPHINENYERFKGKAQWSLEYPFPQFFVCCGFFLVYLLEEVTLKVFSAPHGGGHGHSHGDSGGIGNGNAHHHKHRHHRGEECSEGPLKNYNGNGIEAAGQKAMAPGNGNRQGSSIALGGDESDSSVQSGLPFSKQRSMSMLTHEVVIDESLKYISGGQNVDGSLLKSLTFALAMSLHSVLEGFALGVQDNHTGIMTLFISLIIHKGIEAFSVGLQITRSNSNRLLMVVLTIFVYALMTPIGSLVGVLLTNADMDDLLKDGIVLVLESLAGGTFIYVTFFEVLAQERANDHSNLIQLGAIVVGFLVISGLQVNESLGEKAIQDAAGTTTIIPTV